MNRRLRAVAFAAALLVTAGCSSSPGKSSRSVPGVTATSVTVGTHLPLTGPASPGLSEIAPAAKAYFDYVNDHGGVNGRKIDFVYRDDAYNPARTVSVVHQLVEQDHVFALLGGTGTPTHSKVVKYLNARRVPDLFVASGCRCWDAPAALPYTFGSLPDYVREGKILGTYINKVYPGKKVAYFTQNDDFGKDGIKGLDTVIPSSAVTTRQTYEPGAVDITAQASAVIESKPDVIVTFALPTYIALLRLAQLKLGNHAQLVVNDAAADPKLLSSLLEPHVSKGNSLIQGIVTDVYLTPITDTTSSWYSLFKKVRDHYAHSLPLDQYVNLGMALAYSFAEVLQRSGENPTPDSAVAAMERNGLTGPGLVPFGFSKTSHAGYVGAQIGVIKGDAVVLRGQPMITDDGSGPVTPHTGAVVNAPADGIPPPP